MSPPGWKVSSILLGNSRGQLLITPESKAEMMLSCACVWWESQYQCCKEQYSIGTWNIPVQYCSILYSKIKHQNLRNQQIEINRNG